MLKSTIFEIDLTNNMIQVCQNNKHMELVSSKAISCQKQKSYRKRHNRLLLCSKVVK
jgi:hypothetical protein